MTRKYSFFVISAILLAIALVLAAQVQNIPDTTFPTVRSLMNSNFTYLAGNKLQWQGAWSSSTTYNQSDVVSYTGNTWVSLQGSNTNNGPTAGTFWAQLSSTAGGGGVQAQSNGTNVGSIASNLNFVQGTGILLNLTYSGSTATLTPAIDSAVVVTTKTGSIPLPPATCTNGGTYSAGVWVDYTGASGNCPNPGWGFKTLAASGTAVAYAYNAWPPDFNPSGQVNVIVDYTDNSSDGGNVKMDVAFGCSVVGTNTGGANSFNASSTTGSIAFTPNATNVKEATLSGVNATGCTANSLFVMSLDRDTSVSGNSIDALDILNVRITYTRN